MTLKEFKEIIEGLLEGATLDFEISHPFTWEGALDEVCFIIEEVESTREVILKRIQQAYDDPFFESRGGLYTYNDYTPVHFEDDFDDYSNGSYCLDLLLKNIHKSNGEIFSGKSVEERLIRCLINDY